MPELLTAWLWRDKQKKPGICRAFKFEQPLEAHTYSQAVSTWFQDELVGEQTRY